MALFTPRVTEHFDAERIRMDLSAEDYAKVRRGWRGPETVTDQNTGARYVVKAAPCGLSCYCDAVIVEQLD